MRRILGCGCSFVLALILGVGSAWWAVQAASPDSIRNGAWRYNPLVGSAAAGPYTRARVVAAGPLALNQSEAIYFSATEDDRGRPLRCANTYRVEGRSIDARWWSITAYDSDGFLIPNAKNRYSVNSRDVHQDARSRFTIRLSPAEKKGDWIAAGDGGTFTLALRLYNPAASVREHLTTIPLPHIVPESGNGE